MGIKRVSVILFLLLLNLAAWAQDEFQRHTVQAGETVYSISKRYATSETELIKYNPDIANGLKEGVVLIIPKQATRKETTQRKPEEYFFYTVQAGETLYGLSKRFYCTVDEIIALNPQVKAGLKEEDVIKLPKREAPEQAQQVERDSANFIYHVVEPQETVFSICKAAGISEDQFLELNPFVRETGLQIGQIIRWPKKTTKAVEDVPTDQPERPKDYGIYRIMPGDDLVTIAAKYSTSVEVLVDLNPELKNGVIIGRYIIVPAKKKMVVKTMAREEQPAFWHKPDSAEDRVIHFAVMLPLYLWSNDTLAAEDIEGSTGKVYGKSKLALQFLAGLKLAFDTLSQQGYTIEMDLFDTENDVQRVREICRKIDKSTDAIIGPLFARNVELVTNLLPDMPVISPLSKSVNREGKANLIDCVPSLESEFEQIADFLNEEAEKSNIIFVNTSSGDNHQAIDLLKTRLVAKDSIGPQELWVDAAFSQLGRIHSYLKPGINNILVVVDQNPAFMSDLLTKVNDMMNLDDNNNNDIGVWVVGTSRLFSISTIENRYLNNKNAVAFMPHLVNYEDTTTQLFIQKFRALTNTEPDRFAYYGYDTGLYFAQMMSLYGQLPPVADWPKVRGLYKGFWFEPEPNGAVRNIFVYKLCVRDYTLQQFKQ